MANYAYSNWAANNPNSNARVVFLDGQLGTPKGDASLQMILNSLPKTQASSNIYQSGIFPQASTLPPGPLPSHYGQAPKQLVRTVVSNQGNMAVQTDTPGQLAQPIKTVDQIQMNVASTTNNGCSTCPGKANQGNLVTFVKQAPQYVPVVGPNGAQGWYPAVYQTAATQGPMIRTTDEIRYPSFAMETKASNLPLPALPVATAGFDAPVVKQQVVKTTASRNGQTGQSVLPEIRTIGAVLTLIGSLTIGLGIAGVVLYHTGKNVDSGLSWCNEAHAFENDLSKAVMNSSPGINYVTSGAGILAIMTFIVGVMIMNLQQDRGPMSNCTMWMSIFTLPVLVLMAILSLLSFIMTFRTDGQPPTCVPLTVVTFLVVVMATVPFVLLFVIYCKMQANNHYNQSSINGNQGKTSPLRKVSVIKVNASAAGGPRVQPCTCECCPCCMPARAPCCTGCDPYVNMEESIDDDECDKVVDQKPEPTVIPAPAHNPTGFGAIPVIRYPCANNQYLWGQMAPYGHYSRAAYSPYNLQTK